MAPKVERIKRDSPPEKKKTKASLRGENYWFIRGQAYDFSNFKHPGGPISIGLGKGRDCTGLFETYHPFTDKPRKMLSKYKVKEEVSLPESEKRFQDVFDWDKKSEFYEELKSRVYPLVKDNMKCTWERYSILFILFCMKLYLGYYFFQGYYFTIVLFPLVLWVFGVNTFHDAAHFAMSTNWIVNVIFTYLPPYFSSPYTWYHQHVIGHHVYTNHHKKDPDLHHGTYVFRYNPSSRYYKWYKNQLKYLLVVWFYVVFALSFMCDMWLMIRGYYHRIIKAIKITSPRKFMHIVGRLFTFFMIYLYPFVKYPFLKGFLFSTIPFFTFSTCFSFSSQLNHLTEECFEEKSKDFYKHQVITSHDFACDSVVWFWLTGGLNFQVSHHLFPGLNHSHLWKIQPIVRELCKKYNVKYNYSKTAGEALQKHLDHLSILSKPEGYNKKK